MPSDSLILSIDQGTTSSRAIIFDSSMGIVSVAQQEFPQHYPDDRPLPSGLTDRFARSYVEGDKSKVAITAGSTSPPMPLAETGKPWNSQFMTSKL